MKNSTYKASPVRSFTLYVVSILSLAVFAALITGSGLLVHPSDPIVPVGSSFVGVPGVESNSIDLSRGMEIYANNTASTALEDLTYIQKIYAIDEDALCGQVPDPNCYGSSADPADVEAVIARAEALLNGQSTAWNHDLPFKSDTEFAWYLDETILVLTWQEYQHGVTYYCSEVKVAHPSQFRRMLSDNTFGSSKQYTCSSMAASANAVLASNADFYMYRTSGINVFRGTLYRWDVRLENCFIDDEGDLLVTRKNDLTTEADIKQYMEDHNVRFSLSFGPILVENGVADFIGYYPLGQIDQQAARSAIGQLGETHYLLMNANYTTVNEVAMAMQNHGCITAYALDGGQTGETVFGGKVFNQIVYNSEREVSDIIYFATAISPKGE